MRTQCLLAALLLVCGVSGCMDDDGSGDGAGNGGSGGDGDGDGDAGPDTFAAQVERGADDFGEYCAKCHGNMGQGSSQAPPLVGADALPLDPPASRVLRTEQFHTAADVFAFASEFMPKDNPGSVEEDELIDILAFDLDANGVELDEPLTAENADEVVINP